MRFRKMCQVIGRRKNNHGLGRRNKLIHSAMMPGSEFINL